MDSMEVERILVEVIFVNKLLLPVIPILKLAPPNTSNVKLGEVVLIPTFPDV